MRYSQFTILLAILILYTRKQSTNIREPISLDLMFAIVITRLGFGLSARNILDLLGIGPTTVTSYTKLVTKLLATTLYKRFISIPTGHESVDVIDGFKRLNQWMLLMVSRDL